MLFPGRKGKPQRDALQRAIDRSTDRGRRPEVHGKVLAELMFGFWRYICHRRYLTSLWVPALHRAFPEHGGNASDVRRDVERHVERLHFLRNRVAHHEPIHMRDLTVDLAAVLDIAQWTGGDEVRGWVEAGSRTAALIKAKP